MSCSIFCLKQFSLPLHFWLILSSFFSFFLISFLFFISPPFLPPGRKEVLTQLYYEPCCVSHEFIVARPRHQVFFIPRAYNYRTSSHPHAPAHPRENIPFYYYYIAHHNVIQAFRLNENPYITNRARGDNKTALKNSKFAYEDTERKN